MTSTYPILRLDLGTEILEFAGQRVVSANLVEEINPVSVELPISQLDFRVITEDDSFSMFSGSTYELLSERLPILAYERVDTDTNLLGKFYLATWKNISEREFEFTSVDIIGVMEATDFDGIFWPSPISLSAALVQILSPINVQYTLDASIADTQISGWIPPGTYREALQQICFAAGAVASTARRQRVNIGPITLPDKIPTIRINDSAKTDKQAVELLPLITSIELVSHNYSQGTEQETIFEETLAAGSHKVVFGAPYYNIVIDGPGYVPDLRITESGDFRITGAGDFREAGGEFEFGPNSIFLTMTESGTVTITGFPWVDSKRSFIFNEDGVGEFSTKTTYAIQDATLISTANAQAVLDKLRDYYRQRYKQSVKLFPSEVKPRDIALTNTLYSKKILGTVQRMSLNLTGGYLAETEMVGIEPVYVPPVESPARRARAGVAVVGSGLTRQNAWREYAHA